MKFQSLKGMDDLFSTEIEKWQALENCSREFLEAYGCREIRTPILEQTELFARSIGEASDIVHKEMYAFEDRGGRNIALRPEMTASVVRSVLEHHLIKENEPLNLYYIGPMFRAERPQAGRKRQFHQIGVEVLNAKSVWSDAELLILVRDYLKALGLSKFELKINHLGTEHDRKEFSRSLKEYFAKVASGLCPDCVYRMEKNVLRIFDCKVPSCQKFIQDAPKPQRTGQAAEDFNQIQNYLKVAGVEYICEPRLVRGLDYYTGLVFEVTASGLGAQDAILAGGRYDRLSEDLGGPAMGACGFSVGEERLIQALEAAGVHLGEKAIQSSVYVAVLVEPEKSLSVLSGVRKSLVESKRKAHFSFQKGSLGNHLKRASKMNAAHTIILGEDELGSGEISVKDMKTGEQKRLAPAGLVQYFRVES